MSAERPVSDVRPLTSRRFRDARRVVTPSMRRPYSMCHNMRECVFVKVAVREFECGRCAKNTSMDTGQMTVIGEAGEGVEKRGEGVVEILKSSKSLVSC